MKCLQDKAEWSHYIEQAFTKSEIMKVVVPGIRGRKLEISELMDIAKSHATAPDTKAKIKTAASDVDGAYAAGITGRQKHMQQNFDRREKVVSGHQVKIMIQF